MKTSQCHGVIAIKRDHFIVAPNHYVFNMEDRMSMTRIVPRYLHNLMVWYRVPDLKHSVWLLRSNKQINTNK